MERLTRKNWPQARLRTERFIQIGEGNFLRAFVDWIVWKTDLVCDFDASVVVVQPRSGGHVHLLEEQDGLYHVNLQGLDKGKIVDSLELVDVVSRTVNPYCDYEAYLRLAEQEEMRFVVSNTTEAGIAFNPECKFEDRPAVSYPGKLVQLLYHRYTHFQGDRSKGFIILPCELIFRNGDKLKECIRQYVELWQLDRDFLSWLDDACIICNTLVDRIVPGYPTDTAQRLMEDIGFEDKQLVKGEVFHLWVIEAPENVAKEFPADQAGLNVCFVKSEAPYHERKVTLLNGPHTVLSPVGYLSGLDTVRECCEDELIGRYIYKVMFDELLPTLDLPEDECRQFASDVLERFRNPFVRHPLTSIMLNSFPKFKTRDLPGLKKYLKIEGRLPDGLVLGLAAIICYYKGGKRGLQDICPNDDPSTTKLLKDLWTDGDIDRISREVLAAESIWGENLNLIDGLTFKLESCLRLIEDKGMREAIKTIL